MKQFITYIQEYPRAVLALVGLAATCWLYSDMIDMVRAQTSANLQLVTVIERLAQEVHENSVRLEYLERKQEKKQEQNP